MTETEHVIGDAQAVLNRAYEVLNYLADSNVDEEHPAYDKPDERTRQRDDLQRRVATCRSRLEQRFPGDEPIVERWVRAIDDVQSLIDIAYEGRYPSGYPGDQEEYETAETAAVLSTEHWEEATQRMLQADSG